ncbi:MAG: prepilin-type N-terminal cleavage/methylation domain-containing protein [Patescibacteria group bacterium]
MFFRTQSRGFTLLELLIVIAAFGLIVALGAMSLTSARARMRDAQRISDMNVMRSALNLYWLDKATYPINQEGVRLHEAGTGSDVFTSDGFVPAESAKPPVFLESVPVGPKSAEYYVYKGSENGYSIRFVTERDTTLGAANVYYLHSTGIDQEDVAR